MAGKRKVEFSADVTAQDLQTLETLERLAQEKRAKMRVRKYDQARKRLLTDCPSPATLAQYLEPQYVITPAVDLVSEKLRETLSSYSGRLVVAVPPQEMKALACSTPMLTSRGWSTMGALNVGDEVFHPDGHLTRITHVTPWRDGRTCYRVTTTDGRQVVADEDHLWTVRDRSRRPGGRGKKTESAPWETLTTKELVRRGVLSENGTRPNGRPHRAYRFSLPRQNALISKPVDLPVDPYVLGAWLGDGATACAILTSADPELVDFVREAGYTVDKGAAKYGYYITRRQVVEDARREARRLVEQEGVAVREALRRVGLSIGTPLGIEGLTRGQQPMCPADPTKHVPRLATSFQAQLRDLGVLGNKHVPQEYLTAGTEQRLALLQGLMDTDGTISTDKGRTPQTSFTSCNQALAEAVLYLVRSLGWRATISDRDAKLNGRVVGRSWSVKFTVDAEDEFCPFRLSRKVERVGPRMSRGGERFTVSIKAVELAQTEPVRCIGVDREDGLFLAGDGLLATHNSTLLRWLCFWALLENPERRIVFASYAASLARQSGRIVRAYTEIYGADYGLQLDEAHRDAADWQLADHIGGLFCTGVGGSLTGKPADCLIIDDPTRNQADADSPTIRENLMEWWSAVARTRLAPGAPVIVVQTRWSVNDLAGHLIGEGWPSINIPAVADGVTEDALGREPGEYLESTRGRTVDDWQGIEREVGPRTWNALFMGRPVPLEGGVFKQAWFDDHRVDPGMEPWLREIVVGVDPAETGTGDEAGIIVAGLSLDGQLWILDDASGMYSQEAWGRAACLAWLRWGANRLVIERNLGMKGTIRASWGLLRRQAVAVVGYGVEGAAKILAEGGDFAAASIGQLREVAPYAEEIVDAAADGPREVRLTPKQSKIIRAESATQPFETGRGHLVGRFPKLEHQAVTFNASTSDSPDRVDCLALVVHHLSRGAGSSRILV